MKKDFINKKNPEWKVLATQRVFVRDNLPFSPQVTAIVNELQQTNEIPPFGRNDEQPFDVIGVSIGGEAANADSPSPQK